MGKYPECFPEDFEERILPKGAKPENKQVYRIIKSGIIDRDSFIKSWIWKIQEYILYHALWTWMILNILKMFL